MRVQIDLPAERVTQIKTMMEELGIKRYSDLFDNALTAFQWLITERRRGRTIGSSDCDGKSYVLVMPVVEAVCRSGGQG